LQNPALLVWSGHERLSRGEVLSAERYLSGFAVDNLLELVRRHGRLSAREEADTALHANPADAHDRNGASAMVVDIHCPGRRPTGGADDRREVPGGTPETFRQRRS
jgi:hypothetical protein